LRTLFNDNHADAKMIGGVVGILVTLIIAVLVFYNIAGSIDTDNADDNIAKNVLGRTGTDADNYSIASNATNDIMDQSATFFTIAPIIAIVVVAVVILKYVGQI